LIDSYYLSLQYTSQSKLEFFMTDFFDNWTVQVRKGVLELCILTAMSGEERYGYALVKTLVSVPGLHVAEGSIYPLLSRLKQNGFVETRLEESSDGPARKYYTLSKQGRAQLVLMKRYFNKLAEALQVLEKLAEEPT
jgi:PadR family transcriptional regulator PadR